MQVFERVAQPVAVSTLEGFNGTVFAYGQTGSGKTFTITGGAERYVDRGVIPRTISSIFRELSSRSGYTYQVCPDSAGVWEQLTGQLKELQGVGCGLGRGCLANRSQQTPHSLLLASTISTSAAQLCCPNHPWPAGVHFLPGNI